MSHIAKVKTKIKLLDPLMKALEDLGFEPERATEGQKVEISPGYGNIVHGEIKAHYPYQTYGSRETVKRDFGFAWDGTGENLEIVSDWYGMDRMINTKSLLDKIQQRYAYHVALENLASKGFVLAGETEEDGQIHLTMVKI